MYAIDLHHTYCIYITPYNIMFSFIQLVGRSLQCGYWHATLIACMILQRKRRRWREKVKHIFTLKKAT